MEYGYKTLILVDNSATVSLGNREIVKETLKYLITHAPEQDDFALATFTGQTELLVDYGSKREDYLNAVDKLTFVDKETVPADVLMHTLKQWREADFAMRNILLFTDGMGAGSTVYPIEEVYFRLNESGYPLYVIGLVGQDETQLNTVASMARISHGAYFPTEFEDSEAEVERKLTEQVLKAMEQKRNDAVKEDQDEAETDSGVPEEYEEINETVETRDYEATQYYGAHEESAEAKSLSSSKDLILFAAFFAGLIAVFLLLLLLIRYLGKKSVPSVTASESVSKAAPVRLTLEDLNDAGRFFSPQGFERLVIGSAKKGVDIVIDTDEDISKRHCEIENRGGRFYVRDLFSENGTLLNGEPVYCETPLHTSDVITLGRTKLMVRIQE